MSVADLRGIVAHASQVPAHERAELAERLEVLRGPGTILIETCHRVELHGVGDETIESVSSLLPANATVLQGRAVAEHVVALAVGLRSAVVAEDQILHQLRRSLDASGARGARSSEVHRLFELALRAGRRARSWLPSRRPSLADVALDLVPEPIAGRPVLVVGTGQMGGLAVDAAVRRGGRVSVAARTPGRAAALCRAFDITLVAFDPGPVVESFAVVVVALRGLWTIDRATIDHLARGAAIVIDLSAPPAVPGALGDALGSRLVTVDDLARRPAGAHGDQPIGRLTALAAETVEAYIDWLDHRDDRETARAMSERAEAARRAELGRLWRRLPDLGDAEREEIERMTRHLAMNLLRDPLAKLGDDVDGRRARAARDLFGL